jgi:hypothetical protein
LHVIYAVPFNEHRGIYYVQSTDGGATWQPPATVFDAVAAGWDRADLPRLALDAEAGVLHAVWLRGVLPGAAGDGAVMYARSTDEGRTWSAPLKVAAGAVDWPRVAVAGADQVHLVWSQARAGAESLQLWAQTSPDGGARWSDPAPVYGFEEVSGPASLAAEGTQLYVGAAGDGLGGEATVLYSRWDGAAWGRPEMLGPHTDSGASVGVVLAQSGDHLGAAVRELAEDQYTVLVSSREVAAGQLAPAPTFTPLPLPTPGATPTFEPAPTATPALSDRDAPARVPSGPLARFEPLAPAGAAAGLLVAVALAGGVVWRRRR